VIKGMVIFFGLFFALVTLLLWAKMAPANAAPLLIIVPEISPPEAPALSSRARLAESAQTSGPRSPS
jgi:hypothetical protein